MSRPTVPVCVIHGVEMRCTLNDHRVRFDASWGPYEVWSGDEYTCPIGQERVIVGWAQRAFSRHGDGNFEREATNALTIVGERGGVRP